MSGHDKQHQEATVTSRWAGEELIWTINGKDVTDEALRKWCFHNMGDSYSRYVDVVRKCHTEAWAKANAPVAVSHEAPPALKPYQHPREATLTAAVQEAIRKQMVDFGEIPDRTSPDDFPEGYVLTREEIIGGILNVLEAATAAASAAPSSIGATETVADAVMDVLRDRGYVIGLATALQVVRAAHGSTPSATLPRADGTPLLYNIACMWEQENRDEYWEDQWRELLAAIDQHLVRVNYPGAPAGVTSDGGRA